MQNTKLIERFFLESSLGRILGEQDDCVWSNNFTDFFHLFASLGKIIEGDARQVREAAFNPPAHRGRSRQPFAYTTLVLVGNVSHGQEWFWGGWRKLAAAKHIQNRAGGHVANGARFQKVLTPVVSERFKWQQVQYAVWGDENSVGVRDFRDRLQQHFVEISRNFR